MPEERKVVVVLDPGHGGYEDIAGSTWQGAAGAGPQPMLEKDLALSLARAVKQRLDFTHDVRLTRDRDINLSLSDRARIAREARAAVFLSIHFNAAADVAVNGTETWIAPQASAASHALARDVAGRVARAAGIADRGVRVANFGVLLPWRQDGGTAACLLEVAFLTNPAEAARLVRADYLGQIADAVADAVKALRPVDSAQEFGWQLDAPRKVKQEIILVAGANYPHFDDSGKRTRQFSAGPWRGYCLRLAAHRLKENPKLKITLFDCLLGTREDVTLGSKDKTVTTVEQSFPTPVADDYWNVVGMDTSNPSMTDLLKATIEPANVKSLAKKPQVAYFEGASVLSPKGKPLKLFGEYLPGMSKVTHPVLSITDVYSYIQGFDAAGKKGALLELHFFAHAFNIAKSGYSGGPILLNSDDNPASAERNPLDKDCRADKDFTKPTMDPALFKRAFASDARSFVWGCNFQRGFVRHFVNRVGLSAAELGAGRPMKLTFDKTDSDKPWGEEDEFRSRLGLSATASLRDVKVDLAKVKQILSDVNLVTYQQKLATASGRPVAGAPPGTYSDYDGSSSSLELIHIPMAKKNPFGAGDDNFESALLVFRDNLKVTFDKSFGDHNGLGRGYMNYMP